MSVRELAIRTYKEFARDRGSRLAAALAYFALFAIAPAMLLAVSLASAFLDKAAVNAAVNQSLERFLGPDLSATLVALATSRLATLTSPAAWITVGILFVTSVLALLQFQDAFDVMWNVQARQGTSILRLIRARLAQALVVLVPAALLAAGVFASSLAAVLSSRPFFTRYAGLIDTLGSPLFILVSSALAFVVMFRYLPDAKVPWRSALIGSALAAVAWFVGTWLFGLYVGWASVGSVYGAAGSAFVLLIWLNYSARIILVSCKVSKVISEDEGGAIVPRDYAVSVVARPVETADTSA